MWSTGCQSCVKITLSKNFDPSSFLADFNLLMMGMMALLPATA
jgi:hypothetical protein